MVVAKAPSRLSGALFGMLVAGLAVAQNAAPADQSPLPVPSSPAAQTPPATQSASDVVARATVASNVLIDSAIRQEHRLIVLMRNFKPVVETYIQEEKTDPESRGSSPKTDDYFLSRLDLTGEEPATLPFADREHPKEIRDHPKEIWERKLLKNPQPFTAAGFALPIFPDLEHFNRQNYMFEFVRWEVLGEVRCAVVDV